MSVTPFKELDLYAQIADAIGGTLEEVYNMQERERMDLITVLGLEGVDYNANYQVSPSKYRTRTVVKMEREAEREVNQSAALEDGEASIVEEEKLEKDLNGNIMTSDKGSNTSDVNSEAKESDSNTGDKDSSPNQRKNILVVKQSSSSNSPDMISDLSPTPDTSRKSSWRSKLSLKRKGRKSSIPKRESKDKPETSFHSPDLFVPEDDVTQEPPSAHAQPVPSFLIQKLSSHSSVIADMSGSSSQPSLPSNLVSKILSVHLLPVQDVLARNDLPLHQGQQVAGGGGDWQKYRGVLDIAFEKISKFKSQGLFHAGSEGGLIWADQNMRKLGKKSVQMGKERLELRRSTRKKKKSFSISDSVFVSGDWALSSEEEVGRETPIRVNMFKKTEDEDELPVKDEGYNLGEGEGESEEKKRRGGKRKLFSKNNDYMDDSAESGIEEECFNEDERKKKYPGTRKGLRRTLESLKKEGSLSDLCGD